MGASPGAPPLPANSFGAGDIHQEDANISSAMPSELGGLERTDNEDHTPTGANAATQAQMRSRKRTKLVRTYK